MKYKCLYSILDKKFIEGFKVFCKSLRRNNPWINRIPVDFIITSIDLTNEEKKYCENYYPSIKWRDAEEPPSNFKEAGAKIGKAAFYKLTPFKIEDYDLVISIDCGDMVINKPIADLFSYDEDIAMVKGWTLDHGWHCPKKAGGTFNGGLVLLNKTYRKKEIYENLIKNKVSPYYDQQIINDFFKNKIKELPYIYNFSKRMIECKETDLNEAKIIHYVGEKPWETYKDKNKYEQIESFWHEYSK